MTSKSFKPGQQVLVSKDGHQVPGTVLRRIMANGVWMLRVDTAAGRLTVHPDRVTAR